MATLKDIADRAGVNIATVSRFFNNRNLVKASTAERSNPLSRKSATASAPGARGRARPTASAYGISA